MRTSADALLLHFAIAIFVWQSWLMFLDPAIFLERGDIISRHSLFLTLAYPRSGLQFAAAANFDFSFALKKSMITDGMHVLPAQVPSSPLYIFSFLEQECTPTFFASIAITL
jgi:hypothetical protein